MCTITGGSIPATSSWGSSFTISGTQFGATKGTVSLADSTTGLPVAGGTLVVSSWTDTQIQITLTPTAPQPAGSYKLVITAVLPATPCTTATAIAVSLASGSCTLTAAPSAGPVGTAVLLSGSGFGTTGAIAVGGVNVTPTAPWTDSLLEISIPALPNGATQIVVTRGTGGSCSTVFTVQAAGTQVPCTFAVTPNPVAPGAQVVLTSTTSSFGTTATPVQVGTQSVNASVWTPAEIVLTIPAATPRGSTTITVTEPNNVQCTGTVIVQAGANTVPGNVPNIPARPLESALAFGIDALNRRLLEAAQASGVKWRYEYLRDQAISAAQRVQGYESNVLSVMQMALGKVAAAEQLLNPVLMQAVTTLQNDQHALLDLANDAGVKQVISDVADAAADQLLAEAIIKWLVENDPISFWIGLFDHMIDDVCAFDSGFSRTSTYIRSQFSLIGISDTLQGLLGSIDAQIDQYTAPLKQAVANVVGGTSAAMGNVFRAFDLPLVQREALNAGADVPNVDPLQTLEAALLKTVDTLIRTLKQRIHDTLNDLTKLEDRFVHVMLLVVVLPVLVVFAVGIAAGPFGAAALAAIVLIALEELIHLIAQLLAGPLLDVVNKLKAKVLDTISKLKDLFASTANLLQATSPAFLLEVLSHELRQLKDFLPEPFLDAIASLIHAARDVVLRSAVLLGLGAEQALGYENGTAFDAVHYRYQNLLPVAPQLPGGADPSLFAGAALLRDLGLLEQQRAGITDGKELELVHRLSVLDLLAADRGAFLQFLQTGQLQIDLTEQALLDRKFPGVYRALIKQVRVAGVFDGAADLPPSLAIPVQVTHLGESFTRVKRGANPFAPPLDMPSYLKGGALGGVFYMCGLFKMGFLWFPPDPLHSPFSQLMDQAVAEWKAMQGAQSPLLPYIPNVDITGNAVSEPHAREAWARYLPTLVARNLAALAPAVDSTALTATVKSLLEALLPAEPTASLMAWRQFIFDMRADVPPGTPLSLYDFLIRIPLFQLASASLLAQFPDLKPISGTAYNNLKLSVMNAIWPTQSVFGEPALQTVAGQIFQEAHDAFADRISKWSGAELVADPDANISSLGFAKLHRQQPVETAVYNLLAPAADTAARLFVRAESGDDGSPLAPVGTLQYHPFENRGLEGSLQISLPALDPATATGLTDQVVGPVSLPRTPTLPPLTDLLVEIVFRGCYDKDLAATIRSSRSQQQSAFKRLAGGDPSFLTPGSVAAPARAASDTRTIHVSLRGQRQTVLDTVLANAGSGTALTLADTLMPIGVTTGVFDYELRILNSATLPVNQTNLTVADLQKNVLLTLGDFGVPAGDTTGDLELLEIGLALIPGPAGVRNGTTDPLATAVTVTAIGGNISSLVNLTPGGRLQRLVAPVGGVALSALDAAGEGLSIAVDFTTPNILWDVIVSVTYRATSTSIATAAANVL